MLLQRHNALDLYIWLSFRFPKYFVEREKALEQKEYAVEQIQNALALELQQEQFSHRYVCAYVYCVCMSVSLPSSLTLTISHCLSPTVTTMLKHAASFCRRQ